MRMKTLLKFIAVTQFAAAVLITSSFANASDDVWTACGNQGKNCDIATQDRVLVRYGNLGKNNYFFFGVQGESAVPCSNFVGNPSDDDSKQCWYNEDSSSIPNTTWNKCADERGACNTGTDTPIWVKYGADDKWLFTVQNRTFTCDNDHFGWDPDVGTTKSCWVGYPAIYPSEGPDWTTCATEGNTCDLMATNYSNTGIIIRYGVGDAWNYKIATQSDSFECNNDNFGNPDDGPNKACGITAYLASGVITEGVWNEVLTCRGANCGAKFSITWGSTWSDSVTNQQTWSASVTDSVTAGIAIPPEKASETIAYSGSYANSTTYQQSLSDSLTGSVAVTCDEPVGSDDFRAIYQFATSSAADCLTGTGQCSSKTQTQDYICYTGAQPLPTPPQCLPNACVDGSYCTKCMTD